MGFPIENNRVSLRIKQAGACGGHGTTSSGIRTAAASRAGTDSHQRIRPPTPRVPNSTTRTGCRLPRTGAIALARARKQFRRFMLGNKASKSLVELATDGLYSTHAPRCLVDPSAVKTLDLSHQRRRTSGSRSNPRLSSRAHYAGWTFTGAPIASTHRARCGRRQQNGPSGPAAVAHSGDNVERKKEGKSCLTGGEIPVNSYLIMRMRRKLTRASRRPQPRPVGPE